MARNAEQVYEEHAALVRGAAAGSEFLEYDLHQGWEPLCAFLGKPIPKEPFPSGNVAQDFHQRIEQAMKSRFVRAMRNIAIAGFMGYFAWEYRGKHLPYHVE